MNKRVAAVPLWFLTGWMVAAMAAFVLGLPSWIAPLTAVSVAVVVALDPAGWFSVHQPDIASVCESELVLSGLKAHVSPPQASSLAVDGLSKR